MKLFSTPNCQKILLLNKSLTLKNNVSTIIANDEVPVHIEPTIFMVDEKYILKEYEFWLTVDEFIKQKQRVKRLVNDTQRCCFAGLKKSITKDYFDESKGFACVPGPNRTPKVRFGGLSKTPVNDEHEPGFKLGHTGIC